MIRQVDKSEFVLPACWLRSGLAAIGAWGLLASGCTPGPGYPTATVSGRVTVSGQPVSTGYITFSPLERGPVAGAAITRGQYRLDRVPAGRHRVTFQAQSAEPVTLLDVATGVECRVPRDVLPARYREGVESQISPGTVVRDFEL